MFEQTFKNIDDLLHKDAGCGSELDYVEQTSWVLFLKYLDETHNRSSQHEQSITISNAVRPYFHFKASVKIMPA